MNIISRNNEREISLLKSLDVAQEIETNLGHFEEEIYKCKFSLAKHYKSNGEFGKANQYFKEVFDESNFIYPFQFVALGEYIANHINLKNPEKVIDLINRYKPFIDADPDLKIKMNLFETASFAFLDDAQGLNCCLDNYWPPKNLKIKWFYRFYFAILALLEGRMEDAYREIENLRHRTKHHDEHQIIHHYVNYFHRYTYTYYQFEGYGDHLAKNLTNLYRDINAYDLSIENDVRSYLPYLWLKSKLESLKLP